MICYTDFWRCSMSRTAKSVVCTEKQIADLIRIANSRTEQHQLVTRASIILRCFNGMQIKDIASELKETTKTVRKWRDRFLESGIKGLHDLPRSGAPVSYGEEFRKQVFEKLNTPPPNGLAHWDGTSLSKSLGVSDDAVWRLLRKEGICLSRLRTWCISTDPDFSEKAVDIIGLYLNPPINALVISVDEKPSMQALSRSTGYVVTSDSKIVRGMKSTYRRNGTLNLFAALKVATGLVFAKPTRTKKRVDFLAFMDELLKELSVSTGTQIHVILDNYCIHKRCTEWLECNPNVHFHFTPTSASWLNQIEIWFGILSRKVLRGASFDSTEKLAYAIKEYIDHYNQDCKPFVWRKREVKGSQLRNTITNLCG